MKLKTISTGIVLLFLLLCLTNRGNAQATIYGGCQTSAFSGIIRANYDKTGTLQTGGWNFTSTGYNPQWYTQSFAVVALTVTQDANQTWHSTSTAWIYFWGGRYVKQAAIATCVVTQSTSPTGVVTDSVGLKIVNYFNPNEILYTTGVDRNGNLIQLPDFHGGFYFHL